MKTSMQIHTYIFLAADRFVHGGAEGLFKADAARRGTNACEGLFKVALDAFVGVAAAGFLKTDFLAFTVVAPARLTSAGVSVHSSLLLSVES